MYFFVVSDVLPKKNLITFSPFLRKVIYENLICQHKRKLQNLKIFNNSRLRLKLGRIIFLKIKLLIFFSFYVKIGTEIKLKQLWF